MKKGYLEVSDQLATSDMEDRVYLNTLRRGVYKADIPHVVNGAVFLVVEEDEIYFLGESSGPTAQTYYEVGFSMDPFLYVDPKTLINLEVR